MNLQPPQTGPTEFRLEYDAGRDQYALVVNALGTTQAVILPDTVVETLAARALALRHGIGDKPSLEYDDTTARLIGMAHRVNAREPEQPSLERHTGAHLEAVARVWDRWEAEATALRLLIGSRLARLALDDGQAGG